MLPKIYRVNWKFKLLLAGLIAVGSFWAWQVAQKKSMVLLALDTHTFNNGERANLWLNLGIATTQQRVGVVFLDPQRQWIQFLDAATGQVLSQTLFPATDWLTNFSLIVQNDRNAFITNGSANEANRVITAYSMDTGQILFRQPFEGWINNVQATDKTLLLSTDVVSNPKQPDRRIEGQIVALDSQTGQLRWQRSNSQLQCVNYASTWQADPQSVYLNCDRRSNSIQGSSTIVALSTQTGEIRWQTVISPNRHSKDIPIAVSERQLLTLRQANQGDRLQTQAITLYQFKQYSGQIGHQE
jgi:outer membrane protein assembly factor BamB